MPPIEETKSPPQQVYTSLTASIPPMNPTNPAVFMDRINQMEVGKGNENYDESTKIKRNCISTDIMPWNGPWDSFPSLKNQIVATTLKFGMSHCTDNKVIESFVARKGDTTVILDFADYCTTVSSCQFQYDICSLYRTLMEILMHHGEDIILRQRTTKDGIMAYHDLVTKFEMGGNKTIVLEKWQNFVTTTTYHPNYPNKMSGLANNFAPHFSKIGEFTVSLN